MSAAAGNRLLAAAEYYAGVIGWRLIATAGLVGGRCDCGQEWRHGAPKDLAKHPRWGTNGQKDATTDLEQIRTWWVENPNANVGVLCLENGFIVVDVDPRSGGDESFDVLESRTGGLPATVEACTGEYTLRGKAVRGRHLYFKVPTGYSFKKGPDGLKGIDVKANGYVLAAPSNHGSGQTYEWAVGKAPWEIPMADAPEELLAEIARKGSSGGGGGGGTFGVREWNGEKLDIDAILSAGIHEGERDNKVHQIACSLANDIDPKKGWMVASFKQTIRTINATKVFPPLEDEDIDRICRQAIKLVEESPKTAGLERTLGISVAEMGEIAEGLGGVGGSEEPTPRPAVQAAVELTALPVSGGGGGTEAPAAAEGPGMLDVDAVDPAAGGRIGERSMTDIGNGRRIIDRAGGGVRYTPGLGWFVWNGEYWYPDVDGGVIAEIAKSLPGWIAEEMQRFPEGDQRRDDLLKWALRAKALATRKNAVQDASTDSRTRVPVGQWDAHPDMLGVKNGVINLRTGDLVGANPELYITKQSKVQYTPGLTNPRWREFLNFATGGDLELQRYLQLAAGYTLTGYRDHEVLFLVYGPAGSGKSTLLEVLGTILGDYYIPMDSDVLVEQQGAKSSTEYHMAQLMGKRMIGISEWPDARATKEESVKRLTGDLTISARHPGERPFQFESQAKLWIGTNAKPRIQDAAMWRRIRAINFNHVPERPDPGLKPYLLDPTGGLPGALSWAVEGAVMLLGSTDREPLRAAASRHVQEATEEYRRSEDRMGLFLGEETKEMPGGSIAIKELFVHYRTWCEDRGEKPQSMIAFGKRLEEKGLKLVGSGSRAVLEGRVMTPRLVPTSAGSAEWGALVDSARGSA